MQPVAQNSASSPLYSWGLALAATSILTIGGGSIIWNHREAPPTDLASLAPLDPVRLDKSLVVPPAPIVDGPSQALHHVTYEMENGTRVVKIKVAPDGDELIVDAGTGRLLETRPSRPTAPPPAGKFLAPFTPMM